MNKTAALTLRTFVVCLLLIVCQTVPAVWSRAATQTANLHEAIEAGDAATVKKFLDAGADVNARDARGWTPLALAAKQKNAGIVKMLLDRGADPNAPAEVEEEDGPSWRRSTPLMVAASKGGEEVVRLLLDRRADVNAKDAHGLSALWYATYAGHFGISKLLLRHNSEPDVTGPGGASPLLIASQKSDAELATMLLERGANPNVKGVVRFGDLSDKTPLMYVAAANNVALARLLVEKGANVNAVDEGKRSPLDYAAEAGAVEVMRILLAGKADPNLRDVYGRTPLQSAVMRKRVDAVRLLVEHRADVNVLTENTGPLDEFDRQLWGLTPLMMAASLGDAGIVKLLIEGGAEVNKTARAEEPAEGTNALIKAAMRGSADVVKILLEHKADASMKDAKGHAPLYFAAFNDNPQVITLLASAGADVNFQNESGWTPLMAAVDFNRRATVGALLAAAADVNKRNARGKTALIMAAGNGADSDNAAIIKLLLDAGSDFTLFDDKDRNALMYAAEKGNEGAVRLLVGKGANVNARNKRGRTPLMYAAASLRSVFNYVVETLIAMSAEVNARDSEGNTPLLMAARYGRAVTVEVLLSKGAAINATNKAGDNALLSATGSKWRGDEDMPHLSAAGAVLNAAETASLLIGRGANVNARNADGETALMLASVREGDSGVELVRVLLAKGASPLLRDRVGKTARGRAEEAGNRGVAGVLAVAEGRRMPRGTPVERTAPARALDARAAAVVREPSDAFWGQFVVTTDNGAASVVWAYNSRAQDRMMRAFVADLSAAGFGRGAAPHDLKEFWARLDAGQRERLKSKHAALLTSYDEARVSDEVAQLLAPQLSSMIRRMRGVEEDDADAYNEMIAALDEELARVTPHLFTQLRNKGIGMDADTVNRILGDYFKGPAIRSLRPMMAGGMAAAAWGQLESARSAPFRLLQHKRPVLVDGEPKRFREELARVNLDIIREQQKFLRQADDFKASGGNLREAFPEEEEERPSREEAPVTKEAQQLRDAHERVRRLFIRRMGLIAELVNQWDEETPSVTARQAAERLPAGTLSVVFAYESNPMRPSVSQSDKIHVFLLQGGAHAENEEAQNLTPPILIRTLEISPLELQGDMNAFRMVVTRSNTSADEVASRGRRLFAQLFPGELGDAVRGAQRLVISPDGPLWDMPFAALVTNAAGEPSYLGLQKPLSYTASLTQLAHSKSLPTRLSQGQRPFALVLGDPNFNSTVPQTQASLLVRSFLDPLPASREEAECISKLYDANAPSASRPNDGGVLLLGDAATEASLRRWVERADVVHLATHGYIDTARQLTMNSGVWLTPPKARPARGRLTDDGALQAAEVFNQLKLRADLVVISACEMGRGQDLKGAGVADMIWALHAAGTRSVVASQWEVADQSTSTLMIAFHELLCQGTDKDEALRSAMARLRAAARTAHPYYWAPFVLSGDTKNNLPRGGARCTCDATR